MSNLSAAMTSLLMVPVKLDALVLKQDQMVASASADFSALPYTDGTRDVNADTANLSENILSEPFENQTLNLKAGIHLHWALPDALTRGTHSADGTDFPAVPNRWLVVRSRRPQAGGAPAFESAWVVESDYLAPDGAVNPQGSISVPFDRDPAHGRWQPFRYQGRKVPLPLWVAQDPGAEYLPKLTAAGYGEPTFAAFYPNCLSVFGFYDEEAGTDTRGLQYNVFGWYGDPASDPLARLLRQLPAGLANTDVQKAILETFNWDVELAVRALLLGMLCYARLTFPLSEVSTDNPVPADTSTRVTIAHSGTEALSAYLAQQIASDRKAEVEDKLEAVLLASRLQNRQLDVGAKFFEARHEKSFVAVPGGTLWTIRPVRPGAPADAQGQQPVTLPDDLARDLDTLNLRQSDYDQAQQEILSLRRQLFADWCKYMLCAYPPDDARDDYPEIDPVRYFIDQRGRLALQHRLAATGSLKVKRDASGSVTVEIDSPGTLAEDVAAAVGAVLTDLAAHNAEVATQAGMSYVLQPAPAARYWLPREPVVLLTGPAVQPSNRYGRDGRLACQLLTGTSNVASLLPVQVDTLTYAINLIGTSSGIVEWTGQPWNPFLLEWEVEVLPLARGSNHDPSTDSYDPGFITGGFSLGLDQPDLAVLPDRGALLQRASIYSGTSILTPHASSMMKKPLEDFLDRAGDPPDPDLQQAQEKLDDPSFHCLSQSLGGFNEALLMRRQTLQLPIADPLGFAADQIFAQAMSDAIGSSAATSAAQPLWDFNPIRTGALRLLQLRLVDTFGQVKDLDCSQPLTTEALKTPGNSTLVALPPRLVQPARLNFRWLAAAGDEQEMNDHPATTPLCGWLLPNNLDDSLMIYDNQGKAQGIVDPAGTWRGLAGQPPVPVESIANPHLQRLVKYLREQASDFREAFLSAIDSSLANIDPENFAQHQDLALLLGRPVALVRVLLGLELQGLPAVHQAWNAFRQDLEREDRDDDRFPGVRFPIRLGEYRQLNDGLVGYWQEAPDGSYADQIFYSPQSDPVGHPQIRTHGDDPAPILRTLADPPLRLSLLVDPRGAVHATSGILPTKAITIPPDQYAAALKAIEVAFLTTPILTDAGSLNLPLPVEAGTSWSWLPDGVTTLGKARPEASFAQQEIREGWLKLTPQD